MPAKNGRAPGPSRKDANHNEVRDILRAAGLYVVETYQVGQGFPDLVVTDGARVLLVEIKAPGKRGRISDAEARFHAAWPGDTLIVAEQAAEVLAWFATHDDAARLAAIEALHAVPHGRE